MGTPRLEGSLWSSDKYLLWEITFLRFGERLADCYRGRWGPSLSPRNCVCVFRVARCVGVSLCIYCQSKCYGRRERACAPEWMSRRLSLTFSRSLCVSVPRGQGHGVRTRFQFLVRFGGGHRCQNLSLCVTSCAWACVCGNASFPVSV